MVHDAMGINATTLRALIEAELRGVADPRVHEYINGALIEPHVVFGQWDYGEPGQKYPCWVVFDDVRSKAAISYCEYGFGPRCPWGLFGSGDHDQSMGMDSGWFTTFMDAFFGSVAATKLPIWRVFTVGPNGVRTPLGGEGSWDATWEQIELLRSRDPDGRYDCDHSISYLR